jgi:hypothetical protein
MLSHVTSPTLIQMFGASFLVHLDLPFSWKCFYFAAFCFTLGSVMYHLWCPPLVKEYASYNEYREAGKGFEQLRRLLVEPEAEKVADVFGRGQPIVLYTSAPVKHKIEALVKQSADQEVYQTSFHVLRELQSLSEEELKECFWGFHGPLNRSRYSRRALCGVMYLLGFALITVVIGQNLWFVTTWLWLGPPKP